MALGRAIPKRRPCSASHLVLIPSFNTGALLLAGTVAAARAAWGPVWVVIDGSTDGSAAALTDLHGANAGVRVFALARNAGKGAALRRALDEAAAAGFSHALVMDADGQHPADRIGGFMQASLERPGAMILGQPAFGPDAPRLRVWGRRVSNWLVDLETRRAGVGDSLFGFRVYPIAPLRAAMACSPGMRGYDFDAEAVVRLVWQGVPICRLPAPVRYLQADEGGVSHFRYWRDNWLLARMHARLMLEAVRRRMMG